MTKIPIKIHPLFWLLALFIGWMSTFTLFGTITSVAIIFISVLFHEYGHALTALCFHQKVRIELAVFGGFTYREGHKLKLWEEFLVVFNGPLAGLFLGFVSWIFLKYLTPTQPSLLFILQFTAYANFFWTIINLVPLLPLDGGHLLSIILEAIFGFRGIKMAIIIGLVIGISLSIFFFIIGAFLLGALFLILTFESFRSFRYYRLLTEKDRENKYQELMRSAENDLSAGQIDSALEKFQEIRKGTKKGLLYTVSTQEMARILRHQEKYQEAYELLSSLGKNLTGDNLSLFHFLAYMSGDYETAVKVANQSFQNKPSYEVALINAFCYAALKQPQPSIGWLECAVREGLPSPKETLQKKEFDPIRHDPQFKEYVATQ